MSAHTIPSTSVQLRNTSIGDRFAYGLLVMLVINFGQRIVGIIRNLGFCQFLSDAELGQWALAYSFFFIAAPLSMIGLPGSFGKFVEYFRQRMCLSAYLRRVAIVCLSSILALAFGMIIFKDTFGWMIFGAETSTFIIVWTAVALLSQVIYNFVNEVAVSLRQVRILSWMQFTSGMGFAILGIASLSIIHQWQVLLPSYAAACLIGAVVGVWCVWQKCSVEFQDSASLPHREMWPRVLPFALMLWFSNLLSCSFELSDRYLLLHFAPGGEAVGQAWVGQYYCGRIIPNLLTSLALTLTGILLPYLSADWEAGRFREIERRMGYVLSLFSIAFTGASVAALLFSPLLFDVVFRGRYEPAQSILGLSLLQCIWASVAMLAGTYLLCAEKARAASFFLLIGLAINIGLNIPLIRLYGLTGSVVATLISNALMLILTLICMNRSGCRTDLRTLFLIAFPVVLLFGVEIAAAAIAALIIAAGRTDWILDRQDRIEIDELLAPFFKKARIPLHSLWPNS